jgi:nitroreductase
MSGILFFRTQNLQKMREFYQSIIGCSLWLDQRHCVILQHGNLLLGFCEGDAPDIQGIITFFFPHTAAVDTCYDRLKENAQTEPQKNATFNIYHFFARDPEGRSIEFQCFLHPLPSYATGTEILLTRRSIREYTGDAVPEHVLQNIFEICRFSPTSRNSQSYYYVIIRKKEQLKALASLRGGPSAPLGKAPIAVAVCSDPELSGAYRDDASIAAYHFMLASWSHGVGTCWITGMDRQEVKDMLHIPEHHHVAMITPVGYPADIPDPPPRKNLQEFVKEGMG